MDPIDRDAEFEERLLERQIKAAAQQRAEAPATGQCLNCTDPLPEGQRWCDEHCRDDWEKRKPHTP